MSDTKGQPSASITFNAVTLTVAFAGRPAAIDTSVVVGSKTNNISFAGPGLDVGPTPVISMAVLSGRVDITAFYHEILRASRRAILALADERDFLGYQLSHEHGLVDDEQFEEIVDHYLPKSAQFKEADALSTAIALAILAPERVDSDFIAAVCRCDVDKAIGLISVTRAFLKQPMAQHMRQIAEGASDTAALGADTGK